MQNSRKARLGGLAGLQDPAVMDRKRAEEKAFRGAAAERPAAAAAGDGLGRRSTSRCERLDGDLRPTTTCWKQGQAFNSELFAHRPARWSAWPRKRPSPTPTGSASIASRTSNRSSRMLFSEAPIYDDLETVMLADSLSMYHGDGRG